jgi:DNA-binding Lrp family transcriptional regulator
MVEEIQLDELDKSILNLVQNGDMCVPRVNKLAEILRVPSSTVHSRIKKLEKNGVIAGYDAQVDPQKVGKPLTYFALVKLRYPQTEKDFEFDETIGERIAFSDPRIEEVHTLTGEWELIIKMRVANQEEYYKVAREAIIKAAGGWVTKVSGLAALSTVKERRKISV